MYVVEEVVLFVRVLVFIHFVTFITCESERDYCDKDSERCSEDGVYKYHGVTSYEDYAIRDRLDDDYELIDIRPKLALKKTTKTLEQYPNSPRGMMNMALAYSVVFNSRESSIEFPEYYSNLNTLFSSMVSLPTEVIVPSLYNQMCQLWMNLADQTNNTETVLNVATACLERKTFLAKTTLFGLRGTHAINNFLKKDYKAALSALLTLKAEIADRDYKEGVKNPVDIVLNILYLVIIRILNKEEQPSLRVSLQQEFSNLRKKSPSELQAQKDRYDDLIKSAKEQDFDDQTLSVLYGGGVDAGIYLSKYQRPVEIIPDLRSKPVWDLLDLDQETVKLIKNLQKNWKTILAEGKKLKETEPQWMADKHLLQNGTWDQLQFIGKSVDMNGNPSTKTVCNIAPTTCSLVLGITSAFCPSCTSKWSVLGSNSHIGSHCGPTNGRLRVHLGLQVPEGCSMRIAETYVNWQEGEVLVFDDSFEHEVWNTSGEERMIFILDIFHPDLSDSQKREDKFKVIS